MSTCFLISTLSLVVVVFICAGVHHTCLPAGMSCHGLILLAVVVTKERKREAILERNEPACTHTGPVVGGRDRS